MATDPSTERPLAASPSATLSAAQLAVAVRRARADAGKSAALLMADPIAIVGIGCRLPGGESTPITNVDEYGQFLAAGRSGIREIPRGRWEEARESLAPHQLLGGYLDSIDLFDAEFFGIAPREAHSIDPQQRLLLEVCWEALSDAGITPSSLGGSDTGVFAAIYSSDYARLQLHEDAAFDTHTGVGAAHSVAAGRLSFLLNLRGPSMAVDTACSSSLVATHLACQSLRKQECGIAIVAATSLKLLPDEVRAFAHWGMLASDGRAKTFDASADGFVPGEGCAVVVLKRLSDAVAQGAAIHAVIRGSAVNHDGRSSVLTAPNGPAQEAVMLAALRDAQVMAQEITFVETHGTGTSLGDPIEVEALDAVYGPGSGSCLLGAVKTNFGHLEATAGLAGLIKCVVALEQQQIPQNLNFTELNPQIQLRAESRIELANAPRAWARGAKPRFAAVSSFGLGGTNAHVVLEEAPLLPQMTPQASSDLAASEVCLPISAHTASALHAMAQRYIDHLRMPDADLGRLARAAARSRDHGDFRLAVSGSTALSIAEKLEERIANMRLDLLQEQIESTGGEGKIAFVFSGQGSLWPGALESLAKAFPEVEKTLLILERIAKEEAGWSLRAAAESAAQLADTAKAQPVLFSLQVMLAEVLRRRGVLANALAGHSVGEVAAAVTAGVLLPEEGMRLVLKRGRHMGTSQPGRMLAAELSEAEAYTLLSSFNLNRSEQLDLAAVNAPRSVVFAGSATAVDELESQLLEQKNQARRLEIEYAFHSNAMEASARGLKQELQTDAAFAQNRGVRHPAIPLFSTVSGKLWTEADGDADYWSRGIREQVRFRDAVTELVAFGCRTVLEIGPHPVLLRSVAAVAEAAGVKQGIATIATLRRGQPAQGTIAAAIVVFYERGVTIDWKRVYPGQAQRTSIPPYPWERKRYWLADKLPRARAGAGAPIQVQLPTLTNLEASKAPNTPDASKRSWLLGSQISSPFIEGRVWESILDTDAMPWLGEHRWQGRPIFPFAAWLEVARQAAVEAACADPGSVVIREFAVSRRLELKDISVHLQTFASAAHELKLSARSSGDWEPFASGFWDVEDTSSTNPSRDLNAIRKRITGSLGIGVLYERLEQSGLTYGRSFRRLKSVHVGAGFALGEMDASALTDSVQTGIHPCLLDACLQTLQAIQRDGDRGAALLPVSVKSYQWLRLAKVAHVLVEMLPAPSSSLGADAIADLTMFSGDGECVAMIRGLRIRRVAGIVGSTSELAPMWRFAWEEFASHNLTPGDRTGPEIVLTGSLQEVTQQLLRLASRERANPGAMDRVTLMTRGAFSVVPGESVDPEQKALIGLIRSFRAEYPGIAVHILDQTLGQETSEESSEQVSGWLHSRAQESSEVLLRNGKFLRPCLEAFDARPAMLAESELKIATPGLLETLYEEQYELREPASDEIQIECRAHGLNFRDVLTAMGTYAGTAAPFGAECSGIVSIAGANTGFKPGDVVLAFAPGSMGSLVNVKADYAVRKPSAMSFAEAVTIPVAFLTAHYGLSRLASLQRGQTVLIHSALGGLGMAAVQLARLAGAVVFATAGTEERRALLRKQGIGHVFDSRTEDFADEVLRITHGLGVDVILNALSGAKVAAGFRTLKLGGAFLEVGKRDIWSRERASVERPDARYWAFDLGEVAAAQPDLIQTLLQEILHRMNQGRLAILPMEAYSIEDAEHAFRKMAGGRHVGKLVLTRRERALPTETWSNALRNGTVLITGGTGALGVATARWLLEQGAHRVVLMSRSGSSEAALRLRQQFSGRVLLEQADVAQFDQVNAVLQRIRNEVDAPLTVVIHAAGEVHDRLFADQNLDMFREAIHTKVAGAEVLAYLTASDPILTTVYFSSAVSVLGSAGQAGYAAANATLDGMAENRSACGLRTLSVQWGAWAGSDSGEGMFAQLSEASIARAIRQGAQPMLPASALSSLQQAILSGQPSVMIADVDWKAYREQFSVGSATRGFFDEFLPLSRSEVFRSAPRLSKPQSAAANPDIATIADIRNAVRADRGPRMEAFVRTAARKVLGLSASRPMPGDTPLQELGLDSLMALELRNMLAQAFERPLSATLLFDYPTIRGLAAYLLALGSSEPNTSDENTKQDDESGVSHASASHIELLAMTEAEAEELLLAELDQETQR